MDAASAPCPIAWGRDYPFRRCFASLRALYTARRRPLVFGQGGGLTLGLLGCSRAATPPPVRLVRRLGLPVGHFGFMRPFSRFPLGGASGSFRKRGFSCRPTFYDRRIVGGKGVLCLRGGVCPICRLGSTFLLIFKSRFLWVLGAGR